MKEGTSVKKNTVRLPPARGRDWPLFCAAGRKIPEIHNNICRGEMPI